MPTFIKAGFWEKTCNPCNGYKGWLNLDQFVGQAGTSGTSGTNGPIGPQGVQGTQGLPGNNGSSGTSGAAGDRYQTTSSSTFTLGTSTTLTVGTGLAYTPAQDIIIAYDANNHQVCTVVSYNSGTGALVIGPPVTVVGSGTYSSWSVNLNGAAGGDGSSGTSGLNGSSGTSGAQGVQGLQGVAGSNGTSGTTGTSGSNGSSGTAGTSGSSYNPPFPVTYGLYAQTANATPITGTTVEGSLINGGVGTLTVGANQFSIGDSFRADLAGVISAANNQTLTIRLRAGTSGSVILFNSGAQNLGAAITSDVWSLSINFTVRALGVAGVASIVSLGTFNYSKTNNGTVEGFSFNEVNSTTFDTTVSNTLEITVQWGSNNAGNTIYSDIFVLNKIY